MYVILKNDEGYILSFYNKEKKANDKMIAKNKNDIEISKIKEASFKDQSEHFKITIKNKAIQNNNKQKDILPKTGSQSFNKVNIIINLCLITLVIKKIRDNM